MTIAVALLALRIIAGGLFSGPLLAVLALLQPEDEGNVRLIISSAGAVGQPWALSRAAV